MTQNSSFINQYFDHVYVLNLERRSDRKISMLQKLGRLGIKAEFVQAINGYSIQNKLEHQTYLENPIGGEMSHPLEIRNQRKLISSPGAWGYLKTYIGVLNDAKKRGFERILCLDDDVIFHKDFENQFLKASRIIPEDWKLLYLGASQYAWKIPHGLEYSDKNKKTVDPQEPFYFPKATDGSFAIGLHISVIDLLILDILKMNCPFDSGPLRTVIQYYPEKCFVLSPNIVIADVSESDLREGFIQNELAEKLHWNMDDYDFPFQQDIVSVIIPAFNAENSIRKSIESILIQSYKSIEVIVVNDASNDQTVKIVEQMIEEEPRIQLISLKTNKGVGVARNNGITASKGDLIAFQDADDISLKDRIATQLIPIYEKNMLFTICRCYRSRCTIEELDIIDQEATVELVKSRRIKNDKGQYEFRDKANIAFATIVYKRSVFENYGIFEDHRFAEDLEMLERVLFFKLNIPFDNKQNGYAFLSKHSSIPTIFKRIEKLMYISSDLNDNNLTVLYKNKEKEKQLILQTFRNKHRLGKLDQFKKLTTSKQLPNYITPNYNTLQIDNFVILPKVEHQILLNKAKEDKHDTVDYETRADIQAKKKQEKTIAALESQKTNVAKKNERIKKLHANIDRIRNSYSWKITAPLRWIERTLKGGQKGTKK